MKNKTIFALVAVAVFALALAGGYYGTPWLMDYQARKVREGYVQPKIPQAVVDRFGRHFSDVRAATEPLYLPEGPFVDTNGNPVKMRDFYGTPTLVNLWATWCLPCVVELPSLYRFQQQYEGRIRVAPIAVQQNKTPAEIADFLKGRDMPGFMGYLDKEGILFKNLGIRGIPTSFLIGSNGQILYRFEGDANWDSPDARAFFDAFLLQIK